MLPIKKPPHSSLLWRKPLSSLIDWVVSYCRAVYYKAKESFGHHKRDIIVYRVKDARDSLEDAKQQFQCALEKFSEITHFGCGDLQDLYRQLNSELDLSQIRAKAVNDRIRVIEDVAEALFDEWQTELDQYTSRSLRSHSRRKLKTTRQHYNRLIKAMYRAEAMIQPVLSAFRDQVLFLKHNLNARAIASLHGELASVGTDVAELITVMEKSIGEANVFMNVLVDHKALPASL